MNSWQTILEDLYPSLLQPEELVHPAARGMAALLKSDSYFGGTLFVCRGGHAKYPDDNLLIIDLEIELGQRKLANDIKAVERVGITFAGHSSLPSVYPLREDFPSDVPHLNLTWGDEPRSLCLFEMPTEEALRLATPFVLIERVRFWMRETAYGKLHGDDQPLDPLIMSAGQVIVLPTPVLGDDSQIFYAFRKSNHDGCPAFLVPASQADTAMWGYGKNGFSAICLTTRPLPHGRIRSVPRNVAELLAIYSELDCDLLGALQTAFREWLSNPELGLLMKQSCLILVSTPIERSPGQIGRHSVKAFLTSCTSEELALGVGSLSSAGGFTGPLFGKAPTDIVIADLKRFSFTVADVHHPFGRAMGRAASGLIQDEGSTSTVTLIGAGAIGSQVAMTAARMGVGQWTIVDPDHLMPHNLARHALGPEYVGWAKAEALATAIRDLLGGDSATPLFGKINDGLISEKALDGANLIIDASASVQVGRWLAIASAHSGRTVSVFMNPSGKDLVILREGVNRTPRLDHVEMSYYWWLANDSGLETHLADGRVGMFPSGGCRTASLSLPQTNIGVLSSIAVKRVLLDALPVEASIEIWKSFELGTTVSKKEADKFREVAIGSWTVAVSEHVIEGIMKARKAAGALETGGILVGSWDRVRRRAYIVGHYDPPPDSIHSATGFVRGSVGVFQTLKSVEFRTAQNLTYVGEWHTHPPGFTSRPSRDDRTLLRWIEEVLIFLDVPSLMMIAGRDGLRLLLGATGEECLLV
jgi:hypothetical protein